MDVVDDAGDRHDAASLGATPTTVNVAPTALPFGK